MLDRSSSTTGVKALVLRSPAMSTAVLLLFVIIVGRYLIRNRSRRLNLPVVGEKGVELSKEEMIQAVAKYSDTPFVIPMSPPMVILPEAIFEEVRNLPEDQVSFYKEVERMFVGKHTNIGPPRPEVVAAVKIDLTRQFASTVEGLQDEIRYSFTKELGECKEWTAVPLYAKMLRVVALLSGRVFVGRPLSREEEWINATINYTVDCVAAADAIRAYPPWLRPLVAGFLPEIKRVHEYKKKGGKLLEPILKAQLSKTANEKIQSEETGDEQGTMISWICSHMNEDKRQDPVALAENQMILSFAAIHTTSMATCQAIYDLITRREYIQPLREEIDKVIAEDGQDHDGDGFLKVKKQSLTKLRKLDSFLKESQRMSPPSIVSSIRLVLSPLKLSTGHTIPVGTRIAIPSYAVHVSPNTLTYSPTYNPPTNAPPHEFDGFRFSRLREMAGKENKHQFVTTSTDSLIFGHGNHACPGRFFASNEIKVVMIELLRSWDVRLKGDVDCVGGAEKRPENHVRDLGLTPNVMAEVEFKHREGVH